jgi:hypothetical protein
MIRNRNKKKKEKSKNLNNVNISVVIGNQENNEENLIPKQTKQIKTKQIKKQPEENNDDVKQQDVLIKKLKGLILEFNNEKNKLIQKNIDIPNEIFSLPELDISTNNEILNFINVIQNKILLLKNLQSNLASKINNIPNNISNNIPNNYPNNFQTNVRNPIPYGFPAYYSQTQPINQSQPIIRNPLVQPVVPVVPPVVPVVPAVIPIVPDLTPSESTDNEPENPVVPDLTPSQTTDNEPTFLSWEQFLTIWNETIKSKLSPLKINSLNLPDSQDAISYLTKINDDVNDAINRGKWNADKISLYNNKKQESQAGGNITNGGFKKEIEVKIQALYENIDDIKEPPEEVPNAEPVLPPKRTDEEDDVPNFTDSNNILLSELQNRLNRLLQYKAEATPAVFEEIPPDDNSQRITTERYNQWKASVEEINSLIKNIEQFINDNKNNFVIDLTDKVESLQKRQVIRDLTDDYQTFIALTTLTNIEDLTKNENYRDEIPYKLIVAPINNPDNTIYLIAKADGFELSDEKFNEEGYKYEQSVDNDNPIPVAPTENSGDDFNQDLVGENPLPVAPIDNSGDEFNEDYIGENPNSSSRQELSLNPKNYCSTWDGISIPIIPQIKNKSLYRCWIRNLRKFKEQVTDEVVMDFIDNEIENALYKYTLIDN